MPITNGIFFQLIYNLGQSKGVFKIIPQSIRGKKLVSTNSYSFLVRVRKQFLGLTTPGDRDLGFAWSNSLTSLNLWVLVPCPGCGPERGGLRLTHLCPRASPLPPTS